MGMGARGWEAARLCPGEFRSLMTAEEAPAPWGPARALSVSCVCAVLLRSILTVGAATITPFAGQDTQAWEERGTCPAAGAGKCRPGGESVTLGSGPRASA